MIGRYFLHSAGIVNKLTGISDVLVLGLLLCFYYKTMGRKRPLEKKYEFVVHKRSMSC